MQGMTVMIVRKMSTKRNRCCDLLFLLLRWFLSFCQVKIYAILFN